MSAFMTSLPEKSLKQLQNIHKEDFLFKIKDQGLQANRTEILFKIIKNQMEIGYPEIWDIHRYALKSLFPEEYLSLSLGHHPYSDVELYEYDPPKNGQNVIKHGISFGEVVSYSSQFGTLIVPCPDDKDETRYVIFSDLYFDDNGRKLSVPPPNIPSKVYTLSIVQQRNEKFRFISARILTEQNYFKQIDQAFKNIYKNDPTTKKLFVAQCIKILKRDLFKIHDFLDVIPVGRKIKI